ncbi:hypothetical protein QL285_009508 [Trifolium repens]|nr:hypothetical protein QL285_009508 [Trifolium repens]
MDDANPMIPEEISTIINGLGWKKLAKQPQSYKAQMVKEFYANLTNLSQKRREVDVRGKGVLYFEANINRFFGIKDEEYQYEATLASMTDEELTNVMKSLTVEGTNWNHKNRVNEWSVKKMSLKPMMRVWYQFLKHSILPTTHNETINKARLMLLHCITCMQHVNVGRIISQEIITCSQKKEGMLYFPRLISGLCKKQLVPQDGKDEMLKPTGGFDARAIEILMKGNTGRKPRLQLSAAEAKVPTTAASSPKVMAELGKIRKDAQIFYAWHTKFTSWLETQLLYCLPVDKKFVSMPLFPMELLLEQSGSDMNL